MIGLAAALFWLPAGSQAAVTVWSEPVRVSTSTTGQVDWFPSVAADNMGNVYIVWNLTPYDDDKGHNATDPEALGQLEYTRWNGESWTPQTDIGLVWYGYALRNALAVDPTGHLQLTYKGWGSLDQRPQSGRTVQDLWYMSADAAYANPLSAWSVPKQISKGGPGYFSDVAIDRQGVVHAIWTAGDSSGIWALFYAHSSDGGRTWSEPITLSGDEPTWWYRAHLKIDPQDRLHVVWEVTGNEANQTTGITFGVTRKAVYAQSLDGGSTWVKHEFTQPLPALKDYDGTPGPQQPIVAADGNGTILLVYREYGTDQILYRQSTDGARWSPPQALPGVKSGVARPYDIYDTATDSIGHLHLVMVGYPSGSSEMSVLHTEWDGQAWARADVIASPPPFPEYPRIAIGDGNRVHVVWFGGDNASISRTPTGIWYSTTTSSAPSTAGQQPQSMLVPLAQNRNVTAPVLTPTPPPILLPRPEALTESQRASYGDAPAGIAGLLRQPVLPTVVAVGLVGLVLAVVFFARWRSVDFERRLGGQ
jgi:hypothetical protein